MKLSRRRAFWNGALNLFLAAFYLWIASVVLGSAFSDPSYRNLGVVAILLILGWAINLSLSELYSPESRDRATADNLRTEQQPQRAPGPAEVMVEIAVDEKRDDETRIKAVEALAAYRESLVRAKLASATLPALAVVVAALITAWTVLTSAAAPP